MYRKKEKKGRNDNYIYTNKNTTHYIALTLYETCKARCYSIPFSSGTRNLLKSNFV